jgi:hypothetical protein
VSSKAECHADGHVPRWRDATAADPAAIPSRPEIELLAAWISSSLALLRFRPGV